MTREDYQDRQQRRIDRMKDHAEKAKQRSDAIWENAHRMANAIPFGQPILVGHHSERRYRNYRNRIHQKQRRSVEEQKKADYWARRVEAAELNHSISSDDPDAVEKLQRRIADCQAAQDLWKAINKIVKSKRKGYTQEQKQADLVTLELDETPVNLTPEQAAAFFEPDFCGRIGIPPYMLQNNNANINRMKKRVQALEARQQAKDEDAEFDTTEGTVTIRYNVYENRVQLLFPDKPSQETRTALKRAGFRWARSHGAWQRHLNNAGKYEAKRVIKTIMCDPDAMDMATNQL